MNSCLVNMNTTALIIIYVFIIWGMSQNNVCVRFNIMPQTLSLDLIEPDTFLYISGHGENSSRVHIDHKHTLLKYRCKVLTTLTCALVIVRLARKCWVWYERKRCIMSEHVYGCSVVDSSRQVACLPPSTSHQRLLTLWKKL